jgi:hypothetical protein
LAYGRSAFRDVVIPPEEFYEIADLSDDLAFLKLEDKFRNALKAKHQRIEGGEDFDAIRDYLNHTIEAAIQLNIPGSDTWVSDLSYGTNSQEYYKQLNDITQAVDRFRVRTQISYARKPGAAPRSAPQRDVQEHGTISGQPVSIPAQSPLSIGAIGLLDEREEPLHVESGAFSGSAFDSTGFAAAAADRRRVNLLTQGAIGAISPASLTDAHAAMQRQVLIVESVLNLRSIDPRVGHNGPPEPIDDAEQKDLEQINDLVALLKAQPERVASLQEPLIVEVDNAGKLANKFKSMGDSFLTKFAESAGTEAGKLLSAKAAFWLTLAYNLNGLVDKALDWIRLLPH